MKYDNQKLRQLRDNIDTYLQRANEEDDHIYKALEESIGDAVSKSMKPLIDDLKEYLKENKEEPKSNG